MCDLTYVLFDLGTRKLFTATKMVSHFRKNERERYILRGMYLSTILIAFDVGIAWNDK